MNTGAFRSNITLYYGTYFYKHPLHSYYVKEISCRVLYEVPVLRQLLEIV